jgi:NAD(P)-dependent dehydrogenase (short-subunit alcohol dehydrogenase family)
VALISGAARGIGAETTRLTVETGAKVVIGEMLDERGREAARTLGDAVRYAQFDVTSEGGLEGDSRRRPRPLRQARHPGQQCWSASR